LKLIQAQQLTTAKDTSESKMTKDTNILHSSTQRADMMSRDAPKEDTNLQLSSSAQGIELQNASDGPRDSLWTITKAIPAFNKPKTGVMIFGLLCSILGGGGMPVQGIIIAKRV